MSKMMWKPGTFEYPIPAAMISCGTMEESNIITVRKAKYTIRKLIYAQWNDEKYSEKD